MRAFTGGGVNLKFMPDPVTGQSTVPLEEVFSFDRNHAICRVDTNPRAFKMRTFELGEVTIGPHQFFMVMEATSIEKYEVSTQPDGRRTVMMRGGLSCTTEVGQAKVRLGSRNVAEHATYLIEAVDAGIGGGKAGDSFAFTVFFDPKETPLNYKIFGPKFTFTGQMVAGEISIIDPRQQNAGLVPRLANDTTYGLSAGIITGDPERGMALAERIQAGMVHVNDSSVHDEPHAPFGGIKGSGLGRHGGKAAIEAFTEQRWVSLQTERRHYAFDH